MATGKRNQFDGLAVNHILSTLLYEIRQVSLDYGFALLSDQARVDDPANQIKSNKAMR